MKKLLFNLVLFLVIVVNNADAQSIIDLGKCNLKIIETNEISSFKAAKGGDVKPSRRDAKFLEIKLEGVANIDGVSAWYPHMFGALFVYRGAVRITPAIALGIKSKNPRSNETIEQWFSDPLVSFTAKYSKGERFDTYVIVEVAKETSDFTLQGPVLIHK